MLIGACGVGRTEAEESTDYSSLTVETLPPPALLIERALEAASYYPERLKDWERRIRLSAFLPRDFRVDFSIRERPVYQYEPITITERAQERGGHITRPEVKRTDIDRIGGAPGSSWTETRIEERDVRQQRETLYWDRVREGRIARTSHDFDWARDIRFGLTWDLSHFMFNREELFAINTQASAARLRRLVLIEVTEHYTELRRTLLDLENNPDDPRLQTDRLVKASFLDIMSDYFITDYLARMELEDEYDRQQTRDAHNEE